MHRLAQAAALASIASAAFVGACDASDGSLSDVPDASDDTSRDGRAYPTEDAPAAACDPDADMLAQVADASIADGASTTGICVGCMKRDCRELLALCSRDCTCQSIMTRGIACYLESQSLGCLSGLASYLVAPATRSTALSLLTCARDNCGEACGIEGGVTSADAASSDSASGDDADAASARD